MASCRVAVAASGGRDSTALLHATARAAAAQGIEVFALHVHHGLMPQADGWLAQVRAQARRWGCAFDSRRLGGRPGAGESVEAWARRERYRALAEMAHQAGCTLVLLAHHRRDQAETWLLQALRGGGPRGLSAMPGLAQRHGLSWARPWLDRPREAIDHYVQRHRLRFVDDGSNADPRYARNALRLSVWPALSQAFPHAETALAAASRQAQQAAALADEVAAEDLPPLQGRSGLDVGAWRELPPARRCNALRAWLRQVLSGPVPDSLLQRLCDELPGRHSARWPTPQGELRLYRGQLAAVLLGSAGTKAANPSAQVIDLSRAGMRRLPGWKGCFIAESTAAGGVAPALLKQVNAAARSGGERFQLAPKSPPRSLRKQFQTRAVPAWQRDGPLLFSADGSLLFVPGLGLDARRLAAPGQAQLALRWLPDVPGPRQPGD